jgi:heat shock protein HslJ
MRTSLKLASLIAAGFLLPACAAPPAGTSSGQSAASLKSITGKVSPAAGAVLPNSAIVNVALLDQTDASAKTVATQMMKTDGQQAPFPFTLDYSTSQLKADHTYALSATVTIEGAPAFVLPAPQKVDAFADAPVAGFNLMVEPVQMAPSTTNDPLQGTQWQLSMVDSGGVPTSPVQGTTITLNFGTDGTVSGSAGCNDYSGGYRVAAGEQIAFLNLASTRKSCPEAVMKLETEYLRLLETGGTYRLAGNRLDLEVDGSKASMRFGLPGTLAAVSPTGSPLSGTNWKLVEIVNNGTETTVAATPEITLFLKNDGSVAGSDGCNDYSGTFTTNGDQITFGPLASTMKACEEAVMQQATAYLQHLQNAATWKGVSETLELTTKDGQHVLRYTFYR